ncbi:MAG: zf-TFIIB domain-containing protein, partial [Gemmatimonadaceae bacterium]
DQCTECSGIWLDKGEMEMLLHSEESGISRVVRDLLGVRFR